MQRWTNKQVFRWAFMKALDYERGFLEVLREEDEEFTETERRIAALERVGKQFLGPEFEKTPLDQMIENAVLVDARSYKPSNHD
jgi:hypothetical protein